MNKPCPSCNRPASGRFCSHCGASVSGESACRECSAALQPGARFCNECGAVAGAPAAETAARPAGAAGGGLPTAWIVAAVAVVALLGVVLLPRFRADTSAPSAVAPATAVPAGGAPMAGAQGINLSSMTPREAADRLFDRIMRTASQGDSAGARGFIPMALDAYALLDELDADAHYHVGVLRLMNGEPDKARAAADAILAVDPNHLFGLFTAAQAAQQVGDTQEATSLFRRFLDSYPTELSRDLPEYTAHAPAIPEMRAEAQAAVQGTR